MLARNLFLSVARQARQQATSKVYVPALGAVASSSRLVFPHQSFSTSGPRRQDRTLEEKRDAAATAGGHSSEETKVSELWNSVIDAIDSDYRKSERPKSEHKRGSPEARAAEREARFEQKWQNRVVFGANLPGGTPSAGRTVEVSSDHGRHGSATEGEDVARAYAMMMGTLRRNNIRRELNLTQRYEKPNQERRRKRSERHRRRFADLVRKKVQLVSVSQPVHVCPAAS